MVSLSTGSLSIHAIRSQILNTLLDTWLRDTRDQKGWGNKRWSLRISEKFTYPGQRNDVSKTFVFHFSPPKAKEGNKSISTNFSLKQTKCSHPKCLSGSMSSSAGRDLPKYAMMPVSKCPTVHRQVSEAKPPRSGLVCLTDATKQTTPLNPTPVSVNIPGYGNDTGRFLLICGQFQNLFHNPQV